MKNRLNVSIGHDSLASILLIKMENHSGLSFCIRFKHEKKNSMTLIISAEVKTHDRIKTLSTKKKYQSPLFAVSSYDKRTKDDHISNSSILEKALNYQRMQLMKSTNCICF